MDNQQARKYQLKKQIPSESESQKSWIELLDTLHKYYPLYAEQLEKIPDTLKMRKLLDVIIKDFEKKQTLIE